MLYVINHLDHNACCKPRLILPSTVVAICTAISCMSCYAFCLLLFECLVCVHQKLKLALWSACSCLGLHRPAALMSVRLSCPDLKCLIGPSTTRALMAWTSATKATRTVLFLHISPCLYSATHSPHWHECHMYTCVERF